MSSTQKSLKDVARRETILFLVLLLTGLLLLPAIIYFIGKSVFGAYEANGFMTFYGMLHSEFRAGVPVVWFLMLSPYIIWQLFRLTAWGFGGSSTSHR
jgi:hypothetical protein